MSPHWRFGRCELQPVQRVLLVDGKPAPLGARAFDLLLALVERRDRLVNKDELLDVVWPGLVVEENNLAVHVSALRKLLGPSAIATVPGRGYRLAVAVEEDVAGVLAEPAGASGDTAAAAPRTNLPLMPERLIGRAADAALLREVLQEHRLVTVLGAGGIGKTRLAQAVAGELAERYAHGVWWVDLAALSSEDHIVPAIAHSANLALGDGEAFGMLQRALSGRDTLLLLDNCEHLAAAVARLAQAVVEAGPNARVLATSQVPLRAPGEHLFRLGPLAIPPHDAPPAVARTFGAIELLERRAQSLDRHFGIADDTIGEAVALCERLDGIPLAIEMAAARVPMLGLHTLNSRLDGRLRLLRSFDRDAPRRHQTLQAMLDWSHGLLSPAEQAVLRRMSVFCSSFRLEMAEQVGAGDIDRWDVLDALGGLIDRSLIQVQPTDQPRYRLLESTRLYAARQLERAGEAASTLDRRDAALATLADEAETQFWKTSDAAWLAEHAADYVDLQAAFDRACTQRHAGVAASTGIALLRLDHLRNVNPALRRRAAEAHALLAVANGRARALLWNCVAPHGLTAVTVVPRLAAAREAVGAWREVGDLPQLYLALGFHAYESARAGDYAGADDLLDEATAMEDPAWPPRLLMRGAAHASAVAIHRADASGYRRHSKDELALAMRAGAVRAAAWARLKLADAALMAGDTPEAVDLGRGAVTELQALDQPANLGLALSNLCAALLLAGDVDAARAAGAQALPLVWQQGWGHVLLDHLALVAALSGRSDLAAQLLGYLDAWYAANQDARQPNEARSAELAGAAIERDVGAEVLMRSRAAGAALSAADAELCAAQAVASNDG